MACTKEFIEDLREHLEPAGTIELVRMFGEYGVYLNGKVIGLACDNTFYLKITAAGRALLGPDAEEGQAYPGSRPYFVIDSSEDPARLSQLLSDSWQELPFPKPKKTKHA